MSHKLGVRAAIVSTSLLAAFGCANQQKSNTSMAKDVVINDGGQHIANFDHVTGSIFQESGWIVWTGQALQADGSAVIDQNGSPVVFHKKLRVGTLMDNLHTDLDGTPFQAQILPFMTEATASTQEIHVDLGDITLVGGSLVSAKAAMAHVALVAVDDIDATGVDDTGAQ